MEYPTTEDFLPFRIFHYLGLISLQDYYESKWKNILHDYAYSRVIYSWILLAGLPLCFQSAFIYAIHDRSEFLQRLFEALAMFMFVTVGFLIKLKLGAILTLYSYLKNKIIAKANKNIYDSCKRKVILILRVNLILCICLVVGFILDTWLPITPRRMELMKSLYHLKPPYRKLPQMVRIPFVESYSLPVYVVFYLLETHASVLCLASLYFISSLEITFTVPLTGQYEMLCEFVRLIGREQRDGNGERMFYTDVANGGSRYVTEPELYGKQR